MVGSLLRAEFLQLLFRRRVSASLVGVVLLGIALPVLLLGDMSPLTGDTMVSAQASFEAGDLATARTRLDWVLRNGRDEQREETGGQHHAAGKAEHRRHQSRLRSTQKKRQFFPVTNRARRQNHWKLDVGSSPSPHYDHFV